MVLAHGDVADPVHVIPLQGDGPVDAHIRQSGAPVPAGLVEGLPQVGRPGNGVAVVGVQVVLRVPLCEIPGGGRELQPQGVLPRAQELLHVVGVGPMHVLHPVQGHPVEGDAADGVQPLEGQLHILPRQQRLVRLHLGLKGAVLIRQGGEALVVEPVEGVGDAPALIKHTVESTGGPDMPRASWPS